ncbi:MULTISPECIES: DNA recombination protein RmuC [unclassified Saccharibacter]|uniref:DNA recombination protein RmuC n=1 Tax=unclassified Saccharibacter TaxID=2648722 RepID=UPI001329336C|nr:DNA recombination protein RmuC [Saccharibacter sp. EH611]MXV56917.1 DNA recombination protein RmuC [Saccharibacter sp. EH70]MXV66723.1 DNA recombination protein RmuC [Saccharibacter sp. EH60]
MSIEFILLIVIIILLIVNVFLSLRKTTPSPLDTRYLASIEQLPAALREEGRFAREDVRSVLQDQYHKTQTSFGELGKFQAEQLSAMRREAMEGRRHLEEALQRHVESFSSAQTSRLKEMNEAVQGLSDRLLAGQEKGFDDVRFSLKEVTDKVSSLIEVNATAQEKLRETVSGALTNLQRDNAEKLERMRATVEEKLQGTLEKRLGESFRLVSDRLEQVHQGLGEMQSIATGVGDLKRVLSNVKSRGGWGEVQLGMLLEDMLTAEQYQSNVHIPPTSTEVVEYAVRLPGKEHDDQPVWLPIDAKFPYEDYDRLLNAQESGDVEATEREGKALERVVKAQAKKICEHYVHPPYSTDFAIMYLPTEGLFAEVIRRPGLIRQLQKDHRVIVQGPTTLSALLSSLQIGFRTLAIEKRSSEVWHVLGAAKAEFGKYGQVWEKLGKQLDTARRTVEEAGRRTRAVERNLKRVETLEQPEESSNHGGLPYDLGHSFDASEDEERLL